MVPLATPSRPGRRVPRRRAERTSASARRGARRHLRPRPRVRVRGVRRATFLPEVDVARLVTARVPGRGRPTLALPAVGRRSRTGADRSPPPGPVPEPGNGSRPRRARRPRRRRAAESPKALNALSGELMSALVDALAELDADPEIRAIVLGGNERAFAAGADINELAAGTPISLYESRRLEHWDSIRASAHAARRSGVRVLSRRRVRAGDALRPDRRLRDGPLRAAGDQPRCPPRRGRDATADARGRQGGGDGHDPHGADALGRRGALVRARRARRREGGVADRGEARRGRDRGEVAGRAPARDRGGRHGVRVAALGRGRLRAPRVLSRARLGGRGRRAERIPREAAARLPRAGSVAESPMGSPTSRPDARARARGPSAGSTRRAAERGVAEQTTHLFGRSLSPNPTILFLVPAIRRLRALRRRASPHPPRTFRSPGTTSWGGLCPRDARPLRRRAPAICPRMAEVEVTRADAVQTITLNRPDKLNAFTRAVHVELNAASSRRATPPCARS